MKRNAALLGVSAIALSVVAIPVGAGVMNAESAVTTTVAGVPSTNGQPFDQTGTSDASLAATGATFLLLGIGTLSLAHRRRWRTMDLRDRSLDIRDGAGKEVRA